MALLSQWNKPSATHKALILGIIWVISGGALLLASAPAHACNHEPTKTKTASKYRSPLDLSNLTPVEQKILEARVAERRETLPYQFLSLHRCPSLSNDALTAFEQQNYAQALTLLDRAIAEDPASLTRWLDRAMVHYYLGDEDAARADAKQVRRRFTYPRSRRAQKAYRQLMIQLDGKAPDPRRAVELPKASFVELVISDKNHI